MIEDEFEIDEVNEYERQCRYEDWVIREREYYASFNPHYEAPLYPGDYRNKYYEDLITYSEHEEG